MKNIALASLLSPLLSSFLAALAVLPASAVAQQLYRCGNTYSQTPCAIDAAPKKLPTVAAPDAPAGPQGKELCSSDGIKLLGLPDPETARIGTVVKGGSEVIQYAGKPTVARKYLMTVNAKNVYGGYEGDRVFQCFVSEDERRILKTGVHRP
jgi:hypothetical protein